MTEPHVPVRATRRTSRFRLCTTFLKPRGALLWSGGSVFRGPGAGSWERLGQHHFVARFKFFLFNLPTSAAGQRGGDQVIFASQAPIHLKLPRPSIFFDAAGALTAQGCLINETATRFE